MSSSSGNSAPGPGKIWFYAGALGVKRLHAMAGIPPTSAGPAACRATLIGNLKCAAAEPAGAPLPITFNWSNSGPRRARTSCRMMAVILRTPQPNA